ncbi:Ca2+ regulator and membrane fusion protein Fig1-domain-containing protein [Clohesyomyces aquaticus]|uniref:Ca2+ regulator and membrane fusion protein Fig1-domain-containing protein n=1 Tax=Clohesyomyces aquaticus TaxID=1231657 RepID=A0A1Y1Y389_9PLEO|nr:Ca2+ regulator and membrane fusion protein Fig1-domain-containing protein [Clohesyomyces aquaticus]
MGISDRMQNANYRLLTYLLPVPIILFYALPQTGCISNSPGIPNIFTMKLQDPRRSPDSTEIRLGYYGLCILQSDQFFCQSTSGKNTESFLNTAAAASNMSAQRLQVTREMVSAGLKLQSKYIIGLSNGAGVLFIFSLVFITLMKKDFKMPLAETNQIAVKRRSRLRQASLTTIWLSVAFALASAISIQQTINALAFITETNSVSMKITAGQTLIILQWLAFAFSVLFALGVAMMFPRQGGTILSTGSSKMAAQESGPSATSAASQLRALPPPPPSGANAVTKRPPPPPPPPGR